MGAGSYLLMMSATVLAWSVCVLLMCYLPALRGQLTLERLNAAMTVLGLLVGAVYYGASAKRLQDLNCPSWSVAVVAFPLLAIFVLPVLGILPGSRIENDYGPPRRPSGFLKLLGALLLLLLAFFLSFDAFMAYLSTRHVLSGVF